MTILMDNRSGRELPREQEEIFQKVAEESLAYDGFDPACEISISIVTNKEIQAINQQFRNIDAPTDVLSFPQLTFEEGEMADVNEKDEIILGDIVISLDRAEEQAKEYGHSLERELAFLTAHSMLHLLGYDHMEPEEEREMFQMQEEILQKAGYTRN